jgi:hypothetical protein
MMRTILLAAALMVLAGLARAEDEDTGTKIDCSDMPMQFTDKSYDVVCKDYSDHTVLSGGTKIQFLSALDRDEMVILNAADIRALGSIYMMRRGLLEDMKDYYGTQSYGDWRGGGSDAGFETAAYVATDKRNRKSECLAFRRYVNRRAPGIGRMVIGYVCSLDGRDRLVDTLKLLDAPGD